MDTNPSRTHLERAQMLLQRSAPSDLVIAQALVSIAERDALRASVQRVRDVLATC
jgi:hypothetical protein